MKKSIFLVIFVLLLLFSLASQETTTIEFEANIITAEGSIPPDELVMFIIGPRSSSSPIIKGVGKVGVEFNSYQNFAGKIKVKISDMLESPDRKTYNIILPDGKKVSELEYTFYFTPGKTKTKQYLSGDGSIKEMPQYAKPIKIDYVKKEIATTTTSSSTTSTTTTIAKVPEDTETIKLNGIAFTLRDIKQNKYIKSQKEGILVSPTSITVDSNFIPLKTGEIVKFNDEKGYLVSAILASDVTVKIGKYSITFKGNTVMNFDRSITGNIFYIAGGYLKNDHTFEIGNYIVKCKAEGSSILTDISFSSSGKGEITQVVLAEEHTFNIKGINYTFMKGSRFAFWSGGKVMSGILAKNTAVTIGEYSVIVKGNTTGFATMNFDMNENLTMVMIGEPSAIVIAGKSIILKPDRYFAIHSNGKAKWAYVNQNVELPVNGVNTKIAAGQKIEMNEKGEIIKIIND